MTTIRRRTFGLMAFPSSLSLRKRILFLLLIVLALFWAAGVVHMVVREGEGGIGRGFAAKNGDDDDVLISQQLSNDDDDDAKREERRRRRGELEHDSKDWRDRDGKDARNEDRDGIGERGKPVEALSAKDDPMEDDQDDQRYVLEYWTRGPALPDADSLLALKDDALANEHKRIERFITFEDDAGGWNNIRMAFECFVLAAKLLNRTLVLPPRVKFYLLDYGPIKLFQRPDGSFSNGYGDYFDLASLAGGVRLLTTDQFLQKIDLHVPKDVLESAQVSSNSRVATNGQHTKWFMFLREHPYTVIWPSGPSSMGQFSLRDPGRIRAIAIDKRIIHFPVHLSKGLRYLDGAPALVANAPRPVVEYSKGFLRKHLHYTTRIFDEAFAAVKQLGGPLRYSCIHVRRNELQYKSSFLSAQASLQNVNDAFLPNELIYIATDETEPGFFKAFTDEGFKVAKLDDVLPRGNDNATPRLSRKFDGMVEQVICSFARTFVATSTSTFSSYMNRLRLYLWADANRDERIKRWLARTNRSQPDLRCWFHDVAKWRRPGKNGREDLSRGYQCGEGVAFTKLDSMFAETDD